jgi:hypothetical protein
MVFDGENCSTLKSGCLWPLAMEMDGIEDWSVSEILGSCFSPPLLTTATVIPPLLFT